MHTMRLHAPLDEINAPMGNGAPTRPGPVSKKCSHGISGYGVQSIDATLLATYRCARRVRALPSRSDSPHGHSASSQAFAVTESIAPCTRSESERWTARRRGSGSASPYQLCLERSHVPRQRFFAPTAYGLPDDTASTALLMHCSRWPKVIRLGTIRRIFGFALVRGSRLVVCNPQTTITARLRGI
ncbi:hypothetical protein GY45DRAFT_637790 [Cubamyces sp. BRFM 1775]|nr:hypothetical protein GY45DRAFT_637790 [Cubamyces sp. BRFM 1775]